MLEGATLESEVDCCAVATSAALARSCRSYRRSDVMSSSDTRTRACLSSAGGRRVGADAPAATPVPESGARPISRRAASLTAVAEEAPAEAAEGSLDDSIGQVDGIEPATASELEEGTGGELSAS